MIAGFNADQYTDIRADKNNVSPRLGFAYRVNNKMVVRGGYGVFYNPAGSESVYMRRHRMLPFGPINIVDINQFVANPRRVSDGLPAIPNLDPAFVVNNPSGGMLAVNPNFRSGYAQQFNLQVQQQLPYEVIFKVGYVATSAASWTTAMSSTSPSPALARPRPAGL